MQRIPTEIDYAIPGVHSLPHGDVQWAVDPERAVLLIHDMQRFFVRPFVGRMRRHLVDNVATLRSWSHRNSVPVAYTAQPGDMSAQQRGLLRDFWGPGMRVAPEDRAIVPGLEPHDSDRIFTKWRYSAFFRSDLAQRMRDARRDQIILCGVYAHVGVQATAVDAFSNDIAPFVVADATGDFDEAHHLQALRYMAQRCAMVVATDQVVGAIRPCRA